VEQASTLGWERYVGRESCVIGMHTFVASAPLKAIPARFMGIAPTALSIPSAIYASIRPKRSSIPTGGLSSCPTGVLATRRADTGGTIRIAMKSVVVDPDVYDWEREAPRRRPFATTVNLRDTVAGFTRHPNSGVAAERRGTYAGMIQKIPYLHGPRDHGSRVASRVPV
jgi:hypothetical protein